MNIVKPPSTFSPDFNSSVLHVARFATEKDKLAYTKIKEEVQKTFLLDKELKFEGRLIVINPENSGTSFGITRKAIEVFKDNVERRGFHFKWKKEDSSSIAGTKIKIKVTLPQHDLDETRSVSPGWGEAFKGSFIKKEWQARAIPPSPEEVARLQQEGAYRLYQMLAHKIESDIRENKDVSCHSFRVESEYTNPHSASVADWLASDLRGTGNFKVLVDYKKGQNSSPVITVLKAD